MPGLHTLILQQPSERPEAQKTRSLFKNTLEKMKHYPNYVTRLLKDYDSVILGFSGYPDYPLEVFDESKRTVVIEGKAYNKKSDDIAHWLSSLPLDQKTLTSELSKFLLEADGDFIIQMYDKEQGIYLVFNDAIGRLPTYYHSSPSCVIVSREVKFTLPFLDKITFNRDSLAEYMHLCFPLGNRTLINNVYRFTPATLLIADTKKQTLICQNTVSLKLDSEPMKQKLDEVADKLADIFVESVKRRVESFATYKPVISLSGGYDSRTVAASLAKVKVNPTAVTYVSKTSEPQIPVAKEIANCLGIEDHKFITVPSPSEPKLENIRRLTYLKDGLNWVNVSYILDFYPKVASDLGTKIIGFTGGGGNEVLQPLWYMKSIRTVKQLAQYISVCERYFTSKSVSRVLDVDEKALMHRLEALLTSYPEATLEGKYKHYFAFERGMWLAQGESRNRFFYWNIAPIVALPFFLEAMKLPDAIKTSWNFYRLFLSKINVRIAEIKYPISTRSRILEKYRTSVPLWLIILYLSQVRQAGSMFKKDEEGIEQLRKFSLAILDRCKIVKEYFNIQRTRELIRREKSLSVLAVLLTVLTYMELIEGEFGAKLR